jgi:hypothetical protein
MTVQPLDYNSLYEFRTAHPSYSSDKWVTTDVTPGSLPNAAPRNAQGNRKQAIGPRLETLGLIGHGTDDATYCLVVQRSTSPLRRNDLGFVSNARKSACPNLRVFQSYSQIRRTEMIQVSPRCVAGIATVAVANRFVPTVPAGYMVATRRTLRCWRRLIRL